MASGTGRTTFGYYIGIVLLAAALGVGVSLVTVLITTPDDSGAIYVLSAPQADECPVGERAPVCFRFDITNTGSTGGTASCLTSPAPGTLAVFPNGNATADVLLASGETRQLYVKVIPDEGNEVLAPSVGCREA